MNLFNLFQKKETKKLPKFSKCKLGMDICSIFPCDANIFEELKIMHTTFESLKGTKNAEENTVFSMYKYLFPEEIYYASDSMRIDIYTKLLIYILLKNFPNTYQHIICVDHIVSAEIGCALGKSKYIGVKIDRILYTKDTLFCTQEQKCKVNDRILLVDLYNKQLLHVNILNISDKNDAHFIAEIYGISACSGITKSISNFASMYRNVLTCKIGDIVYYTKDMQICEAKIVDIFYTEYRLYDSATHMYFRTNRIYTNRLAAFFGDLFWPDSTRKMVAGRNNVEFPKII